MDKQTSITPVQFMFLVFGTIVGVGFITLPRGVVEKAKEDAWITVIFSLLISLGALFLVMCTVRQMRNESIIEFNLKLFGRVIGSAFNLLFALYFLFFSVTGLRTMAEIVRTEMLPFTPLEVIIVSMLLTVLYSTWHGLMPIVRLNESGLPITFFFVLLFLLLAFLEADWHELRMPFAEGVTPSLQAIPGTVYSFLGFEILYLYYPFVSQHKKIPGSIAAGVILAGLFYAFITVGTLVTLGPEVTMTQTFPLITMAKVVEVVRQFVERAELLLIVLWLPLAFTTHVITYYSCAFVLSRWIPFVSMRWWQLLLFPAVYMLALYPDNQIEMEQWAEIVGKAGLFILVVFPLLVMLWGWVRKKISGWSSDERKEA